MKNYFLIEVEMYKIYYETFLMILKMNYKMQD